MEIENTTPKNWSFGSHIAKNINKIWFSDPVMNHFCPTPSFDLIEEKKQKGILKDGEAEKIKETWKHFAKIIWTSLVSFAKFKAGLETRARKGVKDGATVIFLSRVISVTFIGITEKFKVEVASDTQPLNVEEIDDVVSRINRDKPVFIEEYRISGFAINYVSVPGYTPITHEFYGLRFTFPFAKYQHKITMEYENFIGSFAQSIIKANYDRDPSIWFTTVSVMYDSMPITGMVYGSANLD